MADLKYTIDEFNRQQEEAIVEREAQKLNLPYVNLEKYPISPDVINLYPPEDLNKFHFLPYLKMGKIIKVAAVEPDNQIFSEYIKKPIGSNKIELAMISESSFKSALETYHQIRLSTETKKVEKRDYLDEITGISSVAELAKQTSTTELLDLIVAGAFKSEASDIHIEPSETDFLVRFRVDGILQDVATLPIHPYQQLLARVMFMSEMKMDVRDKPQDGSLTIKFVNGDHVDIRVSIMPSTYGQSIVLRLLGQEKTLLSLDNFGFRPDALSTIKEAISHPHGMILTSGPTGSGKSSTMYSILLYLRKPGVKIITLENPIEFKIDGIEQSPIHPGEGYEFADGLRASLRQDPDVLMVGEIRDGETAEIAIQAAMTGHLLLSTVHANSAPAVFVRLLEIGVRPFLLAGSINLIMAQRLVRKICPDCRTEYQPSSEEINLLKSNLDIIKDKLGEDARAKLEAPSFTLYHGRGCSKCNNSGYKGRQVVVEYLIPGKQIEELVTKSASIAEFEQIALAQGMITMEQDGLAKVLFGITTIEEVVRVTKN